PCVIGVSCAKAGLRARPDNILTTQSHFILFYLRRVSAANAAEFNRSEETVCHTLFHRQGNSHR
ncbi:hypothetical protein, partial [Escherichia coli]|uniref:hypothetical protein n=1 Tax=Escherichia coli TaxID=562 RepID=UPI001967A27C